MRTHQVDYNFVPLVSDKIDFQIATGTNWSKVDANSICHFAKASKLKMKLISRFAMSSGEMSGSEGHMLKDFNGISLVVSTSSNI